MISPIIIIFLYLYSNLISEFEEITSNIHIEKEKKKKNLEINLKKSHRKFFRHRYSYRERKKKRKISTEICHRDRIGTIDVGLYHSLSYVFGGRTWALIFDKPSWQALLVCCRNGLSEVTGRGRHRCGRFHFVVAAIGIARGLSPVGDATSPTFIHLFVRVRMAASRNGKHPGQPLPAHPHPLISGEQNHHRFHFILSVTSPGILPTPVLMISAGVQSISMQVRRRGRHCSKSGFAGRGKWFRGKKRPNRAGGTMIHLVTPHATNPNAVLSQDDVAETKNDKIPWGTTAYLCHKFPYGLDKEILHLEFLIRGGKGWVDASWVKL